MRNKPFETLYVRWKHKVRGYVVTISNIRNYRNEQTGLYYSQVLTEGKKTGPAVWSAEVFQMTFTPIGRKRKPAKTVLDLPEDF